ncbi:glyoxylate/hydroxypyruvate reductase A [Bradyrhizobium sp. AUGA SZCCT0169]|uniref:2-hydroxyacid dehydrogenase n=1 Tax=Bradyrhizobium sp. AUGA SZCCT0169 TaxID=2807663 RepID=UPI001BABEF04|nr:glyoxylate/hydroxypyruvate reductase A [Bradyrhizobium sp. AUGA SZCCT0169]MBR1250803.1 glyoxylate/hydroxypyruvate reductase A [Bradyrhizobium sp. AUGA SZCCT0169]
MRCALVSSSLDIRGYLGAEFARIADRIEIVDHRRNGSDADISLAIAWHPPADAFERYPNLKAVCSIGAGVDNIVACPSLRPDIDVVRIVDPLQAQTMSGFVIWHAISHQRRFATYLAQQRDGIWKRLPQRAAQDVPVGILGYGEIGQRVAADLAQLGFPVMAWSRTAKPTPASVRGFHGPAGLSAMLGESEVLVNLLPLTQETQGILSAKLFARMRRGGYLIQVGRGEHLVEADLLAALESGQLDGAALDVFAAEPLAPAHPFWHHPKIVVTPHDACEVRVEAVATTVVATADAIQTGRRPPNAIDRQRGY